MLDACVLTIVRNGEDYLESCLLQIIDYVSTIRITVDKRSNDRTKGIVDRLAARYPNIVVSHFDVQDPLVDLVAMRNSQFGFAEKWGFIVD